jgi:hypothetical protein
MNSTSTNSITYKRHATWKYVLGALIAYPVLSLLWMLFDIWVLRPDLLNIDMGTTMNKVRWLGIPLLLVTTLFGGKWLVDAHAADSRAREWQLKTQQLEKLNSAATSEQVRREYVLEVLGLGITVEQYR